MHFCAEGQQIALLGETDLGPILLRSFQIALHNGIQSRNLARFHDRHPVGSFPAGQLHKETSMTLGLAFWICMLLWLVYGFIYIRPLGTSAIGGSALQFVLFLLLGWSVFGAPLHG